MLEEVLRKADLFDVFVVIIGALAIIGFWRGTWNLMDAYLFPGNFVLSQIVSIISGIVILIILSRVK